MPGCATVILVYINYNSSGNSATYVVTTKYIVQCTSCNYQMNVVVDVGLLSTTIDITCNNGTATYAQSAGITFGLVTATVNIGNGKCAGTTIILNSYGAFALNGTLTVGSSKYLGNGTAVNLNGYITALAFTLNNVSLGCGLGILVAMTATEYLTNGAAPDGYIGTKHIGRITTAIYNTNAVVATVYNYGCGSYVGRIVVCHITASVNLRECVTGLRCVGAVNGYGYCSLRCSVGIVTAKYLTSNSTTVNNYLNATIYKSVGSVVTKSAAIEVTVYYALLEPNLSDFTYSIINLTLGTTAVYITVYSGVGLRICCSTYGYCHCIASLGCRTLTATENTVCLMCCISTNLTSVNVECNCTTHRTAGVATAIDTGQYLTAGKSYGCRSAYTGCITTAKQVGYCTAGVVIIICNFGVSGYSCCITASVDVLSNYGNMLCVVIAYGDYGITGYYGCGTLTAAINAFVDGAIIDVNYRTACVRSLVTCTIYIVQ